MKTQLSKPARDRARYTDEYKEQALQLAGQWSQCRQGCGGAGVRPPLLYRWARAERPRANTSTPGQKRLRSVEELEAEIRRLREENAKLLA